MNISRRAVAVIAASIVQRAVPYRSEHDELFGPDKVLVSAWLCLTTLPVPLTIYNISALGWRSDLAAALAASMLPPLAIIIFVARFRVLFSQNALIYRRWGPTILIPYSEIDHIEVTNRTPVAKAAVGAFIVTIRGERYPFWPKLFPRSAVDRFMHLASVRG